MSETSVNLRRKITVAEDLHSVVRTMKALATAAIGQYDASVRSLGAYYQAIELGLGACLRRADRTETARDVKKSPDMIDAFVFGSDQGLVGRFNDAIATFAYKALVDLPGEKRIWAIGERVNARLVALGFPVYKIFELPASVKGISALVGAILLDYEALQRGGGESELYLFFNGSQPAAYYAPVSQRLLPLDNVWLRKLQSSPWPSTGHAQIIGELSVTLGALIREFLFVSLFRACAESLASENASRSLAMQRADKNIDELLKDLRGAFHRLRKDNIDAEMFDVISAFDYSL